VTIKNEVKYRILDRWTKPFHKEDILGIDPEKQDRENQRFGLVNKKDQKRAEA
jgi:hypothetical protein